jgi:hypothetical protein
MMRLSDLFTEDGKLSHTKCWSNIAYATATVVFMVQAYKGTLNSDVWLIYLAVVGTHTAASKFLGMKYGKNNDTPPAA